MNRFAIYTAVIGGYDDIRQPLIIDESFDYILFSNVLQEDKTIGIWQVRKIKYENVVQTKIARYVKTHPEDLLPQYEATLWMDANIVIASTKIYDQFRDLYAKDVIISSICHPLRNCIYDEMLEVLTSDLEYENVILKWGHRLRREHYPKNNGLIETNILFRKNNVSVTQFDSIWWQSILQYSRRDQLSFNYCLWKMNMNIHFYLPIGENARCSDAVKYIDHTNHNNRTIHYDKRVWLLRYFYKHPDSRDEIAKVYYFIYALWLPQFASKIFGQFYRVKDWWFRNHCIGKK